MSDWKKNPTGSVSDHVPHNGTSLQDNPRQFITLGRHIDEGEREHPEATGDFSGLLSDLAIAVKLIWREVSKAGLIDVLGTTHKYNLSGDEVKKLDEFADETIYRAMDHGGHLCALVSEEREGPIEIPPNSL